MFVQKWMKEGRWWCEHTANKHSETKNQDNTRYWICWKGDAKGADTKFSHQQTYLTRTKSRHSTFCTTFVCFVFVGHESWQNERQSILFFMSPLVSPVRVEPFFSTYFILYFYVYSSWRCIVFLISKSILGPWKIKSTKQEKKRNNDERQRHNETRIEQQHFTWPTVCHQPDSQQWASEWTDKRDEIE